MTKLAHCPSFFVFRRLGQQRGIVLTHGRAARDDLADSLPNTLGLIVSSSTR